MDNMDGAMCRETGRANLDSLLQDFTSVPWSGEDMGLPVA